MTAPLPLPFVVALLILPAAIIALAGLLFWWEGRHQGGR